MVPNHRGAGFIPGLVQWVKDLVLPKLWYRSQLRLRFVTGPRNFYMPLLYIYIEREREGERERERDFSVKNVCIYIYIYIERERERDFSVKNNLKRQGKFMHFILFALFGALVDLDIFPDFLMIFAFKTLNPRISVMILVIYSFNKYVSNTDYM